MKRSRTRNAVEIRRGCDHAKKTYDPVLYWEDARFVNGYIFFDDPTCWALVLIGLLLIFYTLATVILHFCYCPYMGDIQTVIREPHLQRGYTFVGRGIQFVRGYQGSAWCDSSVRLEVCRLPYANLFGNSDVRSIYSGFSSARYPSNYHRSIIIEWLLKQTILVRFTYCLSDNYLICMVIPATVIFLAIMNYSSWLSMRFFQFSSHIPYHQELTKYRRNAPSGSL